MTTTLRPAGPEERGAEGTRARSYDICVNSRPVGVVRLATDAQYGPSAGRIRQLLVDEREQRRGRGTVAALASEEVLRGWGCDRIEISVPAGSGAALRLAEALGYRERNRNMRKELRDEPPAPPHGSEARPMGEGEFPAWRAHEDDGVRRALLERGVTRAQAEAKTEATYRTYLPDGAASEGAVLRVLTHEGKDVGTLWVSLGPVPREDTDAWVFAVEVAAERRGRGHGRTLMHTAERACRAAGARVLGLSVFADNAPALCLYGQLGYRTVEHHFYKPLL